MKQWAIFNYEIPYKIEGNVAFLYDSEFGEMFCSLLLNKLPIAYVIDENCKSRYSALDLGVPVISVEAIKETERENPTTLMVVMDIINVEQKKQKLKKEGYIGKIIDLFDFLMGI